ncbi:hypothetical protein SAMN05444506_12319 [Pseudomonas syringae]|nr:hypothetical protein ALQ58_200226 [Pseudomonas syringae pv. apii]SDZ51020.1 hypothetical protein SAMN05444506_12319 [Pseudomonas syringae]
MRPLFRCGSSFTNALRLDQSALAALDSDWKLSCIATANEGQDRPNLRAWMISAMTERDRMSTSLYQQWCVARLNALRLLNHKVTAQAEALMSEDGNIQAGVRLEAAIIFQVFCRHPRTLASLVRELSASADIGLTGDSTCCTSVADLASAQADQQPISSLSGLCDLRAMIASAQFSYDELGSAVGVLGLSNRRDDLHWLRDECAAHNRRLETFVISSQAQLVAPIDPIQQFPCEPAKPLTHPYAPGQMAYFHAAADKSVQEAC